MKAKDIVETSAVYLILMEMVLPELKPGRFLQIFTGGHRRSHSVADAEARLKINDCCCRMIHQLRDVYDATKVRFLIMIVLLIFYSDSCKDC